MNMNVPPKLENWQYMYVNQTVQSYTVEPQQINGFSLKELLLPSFRTQHGNRREVQLDIILLQLTHSIIIIIIYELILHSLT